MATTARKMVGVSADSSSSSDDEQLKRCQEAVWDTGTNRDNDNVKQSRRVVVADHDHDGNELQVTEGFRTHMAKKLSQFLDRHVSETQAVPSSPFAESANCNDDEEGFRLFSTSVPGEMVDESPAPPRRRPLPSSSDSDSEMETRLKEAAVSFKDLLPSSSLPSTVTPPSAEPPCSETKKKKKKKKKPAETTEEDRAAKNTNKQVESAPSPGAQSNGKHTNSEQEHKKVKRKKKKRREGNEEETLT